MQSRFYVSAVGPEHAILALHQEAAIAGAEMIKLQPNCLEPNFSTDRWLWRSPYQFTTSQFPEDELVAYLRENQNILALLKKHGVQLRDAGPVIVSESDENGPRGFYISSELIQLLSSAQASLEIDIDGVKQFGLEARGSK
jgi:hypothetical protein